MAQKRRNSRSAQDGKPRPGLKKGDTTKANKAELMVQLVDLRSRGVSIHQVALTLHIAPITARKWWHQYLQDEPQVDTQLMLTERIKQLEKVVEKALMDYHSNKAYVSDVLSAINAADKYNGVHMAIASRNSKATAGQQQPLMELIIRNVDIEYPPVEEFTNN
jgi:transposase-like protein